MRRVLCKSSCRHSPSLRDPVDSRPHRLLPQPGTQLPPQGSLTLTLEILLPPMLDPLIAVHLPFSWFTSSFSQRPSFSMVFLIKGLWEVSFFNALHEWMDWSVFIVFYSILDCFHSNIIISVQWIISNIFIDKVIISMIYQTKITF